MRDDGREGVFANKNAQSLVMLGGHERFGATTVLRADTIDYSDLNSFAPKTTLSLTAASPFYHVRHDCLGASTVLPANPMNTWALNLQQGTNTVRLADLAYATSPLTFGNEVYHWGTAVSRAGKLIDHSIANTFPVTAMVSLTPPMSPYLASAGYDHLGATVVLPGNSNDRWTPNSVGTSDTIHFANLGAARTGHTVLTIDLIDHSILNAFTVKTTVSLSSLASPYQAIAGRDHLGATAFLAAHSTGWSLNPHGPTNTVRVADFASYSLAQFGGQVDPSGRAMTLFGTNPIDPWTLNQISPTSAIGLAQLAGGTAMLSVAFPVTSGTTETPTHRTRIRRVKARARVVIPAVARSATPSAVHEHCGICQDALGVGDARCRSCAAKRLDIAVEQALEEHEKVAMKAVVERAWQEGWLEAIKTLFPTRMPN